MFSNLRNGTKWILDTLLPAPVLFIFNCPVYHLPLAHSCDGLCTDYLLFDEDCNDVLLSVHDGLGAWKQKKCDKILVLDAVLQLNLPWLFHGQILRKRDRYIYLGSGWQLHYPKVRAFTNTLWLQRIPRLVVPYAHHDITPSCAKNWCLIFRLETRDRPFSLERKLLKTKQSTYATTKPAPRSCNHHNWRGSKKRFWAYSHPPVLQQERRQSCKRAPWGNDVWSTQPE